MNDNVEQRHIVVLNVAGDDGKETIFIYRTLPEQIIDVKQLVAGGVEVTVTLAGKETVPFRVTQSEEEIREAIARCKELDKID